MRRNGEGWKSDNCGDAHFFTCYDERLLVVTQRMTWERALEHCRSLEPVDPRRPASAFQNHRYDLATLLSEDDNAFALEMARKVTNNSVRQFFLLLSLLLFFLQFSNERILCGYMFTRLFNVASCGWAYASWAVGGCGWAERKKCSR